MRPKRQSKLDGLKVRVAELLAELDRHAIAVPLVEEPTKKAFRTRGAGNAQNKKTERRRGELQLLTRRVAQLEEALREKGVLAPASAPRKDEQSESGTESSE